jgi:hypothetical protein
LPVSIDRAEAEPQSSNFRTDSSTNIRLEHTVLCQESKMEDFPIWLKITIYATIGLTVLYTAWGIVSSMLQS